MCNACGFLCCGSDQLGGCGCEHCGEEGCLNLCDICGENECFGDCQADHLEDLEWRGDSHG